MGLFNIIRTNRGSQYLRENEPEFLQRKCHRVGIELLQYVNKAFDAFPGIIFMCQQLTGKGFFAVKGNPGELAAVVIQESRSQTDSLLRGNIRQGGIMVRTVEVIDPAACDQPLLHTP